MLEAVGNALVSSGIQQLNNSLDSKRQEKYQIRAENRQNEEWWKRYEEQRDYNSPLNIMRLIEQAGGNPLTAFSSGYSPNPSNPVSPGLSAPGLTHQNVDPLTSAQIRLMDSETKKNLKDVEVSDSTISLNQAYEDFTKQQTLSESQLTRLRSIEADIQEATKGTQISTYVASLDKMLSEVKNIDQNSEYYRQLSFQVELARAVEQFKLDNILPAELANINADTSLKIANSKLSEQDAQRLRDLTAKDKHDLYLEYQKVAQEYPYLTYQNKLSEKDFDTIISDFVSYSINSDNYSDSFREREVSAQESLAQAKETTSWVNAGSATAMGIAIALSAFGGGRFKAIGEKIIKTVSR